VLHLVEVCAAPHRCATSLRHIAAPHRCATSLRHIAAPHRCATSLRHIAAPHRCTTSLRHIAAPHRCARSLRQIAAPHRCATSLRHIAAPHRCATSLRHIAAPHRCATSLRHIAAPHRCATSLLHIAAPHRCTTSLHHIAAPHRCATSLRHIAAPHRCSTSLHHIAAPHRCTTSLHHIAAPHHVSSLPPSAPRTALRALCLPYTSRLVATHATLSSLPSSPFSQALIPPPGTHVPTRRAHLISCVLPPAPTPSAAQPRVKPCRVVPASLISSALLLIPPALFFSPHQGRIDSSGRLACSYHGWAFAGSGACHLIPQAPQDNPPHPPRALASPRACATAFPTRELHGILFVWPDSASAEQAERTAIPEPEGVEWDAFDMMVHARRLNYSYEIMAENFADPAHIFFAHHGFGPLHSPGRAHEGDQLAVSGETSVRRVTKDGFQGTFHDAVSPATFTFSAPSFVCYNRTLPAPPAATSAAAAAGEAPPVPTTALACLYMTPMRPGECLQGNNEGVEKGNKGAAPRRKTAWGEQFASQRWRAHLFTHSLFDSDHYLLHCQDILLSHKIESIAARHHAAAVARAGPGGMAEQEQAEAERAARRAGSRFWQSEYFLPAPADLFVVAFRQWMGTYAGMLMPWMGVHAGRVGVHMACDGCVSAVLPCTLHGKIECALPSKLRPFFTSFSVWPNHLFTHTVSTQQARPKYASAFSPSPPTDGAVSFPPGYSMPPQPLPKEQVLDRMASHTAHCTSCSSALASLQRAHPMLPALSLLAAAAAVAVPLGFSSASIMFPLVLLLMSAALAVAAWKVHQLIPQFIYVGWDHSKT
ncbi:unnamed protein product, partial [Closterium sp. Naga37s-1]